MTPAHIWGREPVLIVEALKTLLALAVAFGLDLSAEQVAAILAAAGALLALVARSRVWPVE